MSKLGIDKIPQFRIAQLPPSDGIKKLRQSGYLVPIDLECLYTDTMWALAERRGWLEERPDFQKLIRKDLVQRMFETDENPLRELSKPEGLRIRKRFSKSGKASAAGYISRLADAIQKKELASFGPLVREIEAALF